VYRFELIGNDIIAYKIRGKIMFIGLFVCFEPHKHFFSYLAAGKIMILGDVNSSIGFRKEQFENSIKTYDFSTIYSTIPHDQLKSRLLDIIDNCFFNKNGKRKYSYLVISHKKHYFVEYHSDSTQKYSEVEINKILEFLIDNIYVDVRGQVFQQSVGIHMGTNCALLLADLFLYSYEAEYYQKTST
jgi:hypothetical protein